jgi:hypothetical protein
MTNNTANTVDNVTFGVEGDTSNDWSDYLVWIQIFLQGPLY